tara:strand:+ start:77 stop:619 length:543 start_codon:yes stop_codon:yes gene_type:complete
MNTFTAQKLEIYYGKVANGGEIGFRHRTLGPCDPALVGPCLSSNTQDWFIKPAKKVIDLSVLIDSQIDCEFDNGAVIAKLVAVKVDSVGTYYSSNHKKAQDYRECQPRMNHKHAWQGGECPLPEGFMVKPWRRDSLMYGDPVMNATDLRWSYEGYPSDIIQFEVIGLADGYVMPLEVSDE